MAAVHFLLAGAAFEHGAHDNKEDRHKNHGQDGASDHSAQHPSANGPLAGCARAAGQYQGQYAQAIEVMTIGRKRSWAACSAAAATLLPWACKSLANSMIKIAFFADRPMTVIKPTWKYTSLV